MKKLLVIYPQGQSVPEHELASLHTISRLDSQKDSFGHVCDYYECTDFPLNQAREKFPHADILLLGHLLDPQKKSLFAFDMDSTLIRQEVIDELARKQGVFAEVSAVTREAMEGNLDFNESLRRRCSHLAGASVEIFNEVYNELVPNDGVENLLKKLHEKNVVTCVFSGGFDRILNKFALDKGLAYNHANHLEEAAGKLTGKVLGEIVNREKKRDLLVSIREKEGVPVEQSVAVGDGANDLLMLNAAGLGFGFHAKDGLKREITNWFDNTPMTSLLFLFA